MVKRDKNAHQSNHYKATHNSGGKSNKKSGGKGKKGNKSINQFLQIGKPGPHLMKHRQQQQTRKERRANRNAKPKKEPQEYQLQTPFSYQLDVSPPQAQTQAQHSATNRNHNNQTYYPVNGEFQPMEGVPKQMQYPGHRNVNASPYNLRATSFQQHAGQPGKVLPLDFSSHDSDDDPRHQSRRTRQPRQPTQAKSNTTTKNNSNNSNNSKLQDDYEQDIQYKYENRDLPNAPLQTGSSNGAPNSKKEKKPRMSKAAKKERKEERMRNKEEPTEPKIMIKAESTEPKNTLTPQEQQELDAERKKKKKAKKQKARENKRTAKEEKKQQRKDAKATKGRQTGPGLNPYVDPKKETQKRESFIDQLMADMEEKARLQAAGPSSLIQEAQGLPKPSYLTGGGGGDDMKTGADFIQFVESDAEEENTPVTPVSNNNIIVQNDSNNTDNTNHNTPETTAGHKRKRDGYGSDTEGSTGPPPGCPWMGHRQYSKLGSVPRMLTQELKDFVDFISPSREEHKIRQYVHRRIQRTVERLWSDAQVIVFGSFETRLYLPSR